MENLPNIHPGEVLLEEFMKPFNITAYRLSKSLEIPQTRVSQILKGKRRITPDTALKLSSFFGNSAQFWLGLQNDYDMEEAKLKHTELLHRIREKGKQLLGEV
jgi:addiction module HigA family antidote